MKPKIYLNTFTLHKILLIHFPPSLPRSLKQICNSSYLVTSSSLNALSCCLRWSCILLKMSPNTTYNPRNLHLRYGLLNP